MIAKPKCQTKTFNHLNQKGQAACHQVFVHSWPSLVLYSGNESGQMTGNTLVKIGSFPQVRGKHKNIPSRKLTYPTLGKGKSSSNMIFDGIC